MDKITESLLAAMHLELQKTAVEIDDKLQQAEKSFNVVEQHIQKLKEFISTYSFGTSEEEIRFFKEIKPQFLKELIYFSEVFYIEAGKPLGSEAKQKVYFEQYLMTIEVFFDRNQQLYNYYRTGQVYSDENYFVRKAVGVPLNPVYTQDLDPEFSTPYSYMLGQIQAYEHLREYLLRVISNEKQGQMDATEKEKRNTTWTDSKAALIELIYAIHAKGSVNFGNITIKQLVADMECFFNIRLGNVYTVLLGMGIRKKIRTPYLHNLIGSLENKLDEKDE
nr:RteC domain-containing protein [Mucilaginibacter sp. L294]